MSVWPGQRIAFEAVMVFFPIGALAFAPTFLEATATELPICVSEMEEDGSARRNQGKVGEEFGDQTHRPAKKFAGGLASGTKRLNWSFEMLASTKSELLLVPPASPPPARMPGDDVRTSRATPTFSAGATAIGTLALGAAALGAVAVGRLAIGRLTLGRGLVRELHVRRLIVDDLKIGRFSRG